MKIEGKFGPLCLVTARANAVRLYDNADKDTEPHMRYLAGSLLACLDALENALSTPDKRLAGGYSSDNPYKAGWNERGDAVKSAACLLEDEE